MARPKRAPAPCRGARLVRDLPGLAVQCVNSSSSHEPDDEEEHQGTQEGRDDVAAKRFRLNPKARCKQPRDACAEDAYDDVADETKPVTLDKEAGQPSCDSTDHD